MGSGEAEGFLWNAEECHVLTLVLLHTLSPTYRVPPHRSSDQLLPSPRLNGPHLCHEDYPFPRHLLSLCLTSHSVLSQRLLWVTAISVPASGHSLLCLPAALPVTHFVTVTNINFPPDSVILDRST